MEEIKTSKPELPASPVSTHLDRDGHPMMVDVSGKNVTLRIAEAEGFVRLTEATAQAVGNHATAKGDVLKIAELAGIMATKRTSELIPLCHSIRLDNARVECSFDAENRRVKIRATVKASEVTGVEMEALTAVTVAALTVYDMCKGIDRGMSVEGIRLVRKSGGKSGDYVNPEAELPSLLTEAGEKSGSARLEDSHVVRAGVLTVSDKGARGEREDTAGPALRDLLRAWGADVVCRDVVPDEQDAIVGRIREWTDSENLQLILTTGGTGLSPRDVTPGSLLRVADRTVPGIGELMRAASLRHTSNAPLSRGLAVTIGTCLVVALPGSRRGAEQCFEAIRPSLRHAVDILNSWSHEGDAPAENDPASETEP